MDLTHKYQLDCFCHLAVKQSIVWVAVYCYEKYSELNFVVLRKAVVINNKYK